MTIDAENYIAPKPLSAQSFRNELKYVVPLGVANPLMDELEQEHCEKDKHTDETGMYEIASLYYDTDDFRFYMDREESVPYRRKIRFRSYNQGGESQALFVEIKERHKYQISKKRINLVNKEILNSGIPHHQIPLELVCDYLEDTAEGREIKYLSKRLRLEPVVIVRYVRRPLIPKLDPTMRLTLDTRITSDGDSLPLYQPNKEKYVLGGDFGIFEVKSNSTIPLWLQSMLLRYELIQTRFSKYCLAADSAFTLSRPWLKTNHELDESKSQQTENFTKSVGEKAV